MHRSEVRGGPLGPAPSPRRRRRWALVLALATSLWVLPAPAAAASTSQLTWSVVTPAASPPPLRGASAVYDSDNHTVVVFGGIRQDGSYSDETWVWDGSTWTDHTGGPGGVPPARAHASMAFDPSLHQLILFGGETTGGALLGDTWAWNGASWYQLPATATATPPSPRADAAMAYDHDGHLVLFGGVGVAPAAHPVAPGSTTSTSGAGPAGGAGSSSTSGSPPSGSPPSTASTTTTAAAGTRATLDDTWVWSSSGWAPASTAGPPARAGAAITYDSDHGQTVLFGGSAVPPGGAGPGRDLADTWTWDGSQWTQRKPHTSPPARARAVLAYDPAAGGSVLFGGASTVPALGDTWRWDGTTWTLERPLHSPPARSDAAGAYDAPGRQLVVFGGRSATGTPLADTAILTPAAPLTIHPGPPSTTTTTTSTAGSTSGTPAGTSHQLNPGSSTSAGGTSTSATAPLVVTDHTVHQGDLVTLVGGGFMPGARITITFHSTPEVVGQVTADRDGRFTATVAVPPAAAFGAHRFVAAGESEAGGQAELVTAIRVVPLASTSGRTPLLETVILVAVAVALPIGTWAALGVGERFRKRRASTPA